MISRPTLLWCALGLGAGVLSGTLYSPGDGHEDQQTTSPSTLSPQVSAGPALAQNVGPVPFGQDERIARLFGANQQPVALFRRFELAEALRDLSRDQMADLVHHASSLSSAAQAELLPALVERWFELDPDAAQAWVQARPFDYRMNTLWARGNPSGALRAAEKSDGWWSTMLFSAALEALYGNDYTAQIGRALSLPSGEKRENVFGQILAKWAEQDLSEAYAAIDRLPAGAWQEHARRNVLSAAAQRDPVGALEKLGSLLPTLAAGVLGNRMVTEVVEAIAQKDPRLALDWLGTIPSEFRMVPAIATASQWARKEPLSALDWCMSNDVDVTQPGWRDTSRWAPAVLGNVIEFAPREAFARFRELPQGEMRDYLLECAFMESLWHAPKEQLYADNQAMAWEFFNELTPDAQIAKAELFGQKVLQNAPLDDIAAWAQRFPTGPTRSNAIAGAVDAAYQRDPHEAEAMLAKVTAPDDRDAALYRLAQDVGSATPADGAARASEIRSVPLRREALEAIVVPWLKSAPEASRAWLQTAAAIPGDWKQAWLEKR